MIRQAPGRQGRDGSGGEEKGPTTTPPPSAGRGAVWAGLVASVGTLLCCVLPSLLVLAGLGATVAALTSRVPGLVWLSRHKGWVFLAAGLLVFGSRLYSERVAPRAATEGAACPPALGRWTRRAWWLSVVLYGIGLISVYVVGPLLLGSGG